MFAFFSQICVIWYFSACVIVMAPGVACIGSYLETYPAVQQVNDSRQTTPLFFGLIMSFPGGEFDSSGAIAGVRVALDRINNDPTVLPNHTLHYTLTNSSCNRTIAFSALFDQLLVEPTKLAVIGSGCSVATEPTAEISQFYNITQISCVSSSTALSDRTRFQRYFQLLPSEDTIAPSYYGVIKAFGWKRVSIIEQNENLFSVTIARLIKLLKRDNITYNERMFETNDGIAGLGQEPFDSDSRIHIIATYSSHARHLLCEAFHRGIKYPLHLLMTPAWYAPKWWLVEDEEYSCSPSERESVLQTSLAFLHFEFLKDLNLTTTTGITGAEYFKEEERHLHQEPFNLTRLEYAQYCYDAIWTLAYALDHTIKEIDLRNNPTLNHNLAEAYGVNRSFQIEDFTYGNDALTDVIFSQLEETSFDGITGPVSFNYQGVQEPHMQIVYQFRNITNEDGVVELIWYEVGRVIAIDNGTDFVYVGDLDIWPDGVVPYDGIPTKEVVAVALPVTVIYVFLASAGIIFAIICLVFNFTYRNKKGHYHCCNDWLSPPQSRPFRLIRLTSPNFNYVIGFGAIILYLVIFLTVVPIASRLLATILCNLIHWLTAIGYSLCFGTIVAKMFRIYYIFNNPNSKRRSVQDWRLSLIVILFLLVDFIILITYTVVVWYTDDRAIGSKEIVNVEDPQAVQGARQIITNYCAYICDSRSRDIFLGVLYGYKALLQIIALMFAFSIRKVKVKGLNDTKFINAIVYVTSIATAVIIVAAYTLKAQINIFSALFSTGFFIGTTATLGLVFVPKMISLYQDPEGNTIFGKTVRGSSVAGTTSHAIQNIELLKMRIKELENQVATVNGNVCKCNDKLDMDSLDTKEVKEASFSDILRGISATKYSSRESLNSKEVKAASLSSSETLRGNNVNIRQESKTAESDVVSLDAVKGTLSSCKRPFESSLDELNGKYVLTQKDLPQNQPYQEEYDSTSV